MWRSGGRLEAKYEEGDYRLGGGLGGRQGGRLEGGRGSGGRSVS